MTYRSTFSQLAGLAICGLAFWLPSPAQAQDSISYNFSQSQTELSVTVGSSKQINSSHWSYAGPLDNKSNCNNREFPDIPANLKGRAKVTKSGDKKGRAKISVSSANNNKYYCFIIEGYPVPRQLDYNPPTIELGEEGNLLKGKDISQSAYAGPTTVDGKSWQAAVFDNQRAGDNYQCNAANEDLEFRPVSGDLPYVGQYSLGNTNYLSYNVPGFVDEDIKFFNGLKDAVYTTEETNSALIPFIDGAWNDQFTDNIHLCHRVSDNKGNTTYKLMRLDLAGPVIKLEIDGQGIRASSPAVDLDDSTWKYLASSQRTISYSCNLLKDIPQPTGRSTTVAQAEDGHYYCFIVADKQGHVGQAWIKADLDGSSPSQQTETTTNTNENQQNQQLTNPNPTTNQNGDPEPINNQAGEVNEVNPAPNAEPENSSTQTEAAPTETTTPEPEVPAEDQNTEQPELTPTVSKPATINNEPTTSSSSTWTIILALIGVLAVGVGGWLVLKAKTKDKNQPTE